MQPRCRTERVNGYNCTVCEFNGDTFYCHEREVALKNGKRQNVYYFVPKSKLHGGDGRSKPVAIPSKYEVTSDGKIPIVKTR